MISKTCNDKPVKKETDNNSEKELEDKMRFLVRMIIKRVKEDRKNRIYH